MPQITENIACPTPGCSGSRADVYETDDNGNIIARVTSYPCSQCGQ